LYQTNKKKHNYDGVVDSSNAEIKLIPLVNRANKTILSMTKKMAAM